MLMLAIIYVMTKIAIIEDDAAINQMYRMKFETAGFEVLLADDGAHGVELVQKYHPDLILLDLQMPHMSGVEALGRIRKLPGCEQVPVIILTNLGKEEAPAGLDSLRVHSYIVKAESTPRQVVEHVKTALKQLA